MARQGMRMLEDKDRKMLLSMTKSKTFWITAFTIIFASLFTFILTGEKDLYAVDLDKSLTHFGPSPKNIQNRFIDCQVKQDYQYDKDLSKYSNSTQIDYFSPGWQNRIKKDFNALNEAAPLAYSDRPYSEDDGVWLLIIEIERINGIPHYRYLGNHERQNIPYEPWSSAKLLAASAALSKARLMSGGRIGGDAIISGKNIGDIITTAMSYKNTANVVTSSNEAANFLLRSATEEYADRLLNNWLLQNDGSSFFGKFGRPVYNPGSSIWESNGIRTQLPFNYFSGRDQKTMSLLSIGEWLKRLVMHKADPITALPHLTDLDIETIFYGKKGSKMAGGASKGSSLYLHKAVTGIDNMGSYTAPESRQNKRAQEVFEKIGGPNWRVFLKNGAGPSSSRNRGEVTLAGYVCLPENKIGPREFVAVARSSFKNRTKCSGSIECYDEINKASIALESSIKKALTILRQKN